MHIVILGGGGFIGYRLAKELLRVRILGGNPIERLTLVDKNFQENAQKDSILEFITGDFSDNEILEPIILQKPAIIFHLAAVVSGEAEKNFELGMNVNFYGSLNLLELCRKHSVRTRIVFASSCAVFGGDVSQIVMDTTGPKPLSSYGTQKAIVELLMNDYSRRKFVDARSLRLPTIAIRPGKPNAATSSFISSIIREPLTGKTATYPVPPGTEVWIQSPRSVIKNFIHAAELGEEIISTDRVINLPGITTSIKEMIDNLEKIAGATVTKRISQVPDAFLQSIVLTWPPKFNTATAIRLGFVRDQSVEVIIRQFIEEENIVIN